MRLVLFPGSAGEGLGGARSDSFPGSVGDWDWPSLVPRLGTGTRLAWFPGWWGRVRMSLVLFPGSAGRG